MEQAVFPYLLYEDAGRALEWLTGAFGFREVTRMENERGEVGHAELDVGGGTIYLGAPGGDFRNPRRTGVLTALVYALVDDVDGHCERARAAGATIVEEPGDQDYGHRRYAAEDPEGHHWYFAQPVSGGPTA